MSRLTHDLSSSGESVRDYLPIVYLPLVLLLLAGVVGGAVLAGKSIYERRELEKETIVRQDVLAERDRQMVSAAALNAKLQWERSEADTLAEWLSLAIRTQETVAQTLSPYGDDSRVYVREFMLDYSPDQAQVAVVLELLGGRERALAAMREGQALFEAIGYRLLSVTSDTTPEGASLKALLTTPNTF